MYDVPTLFVRRTYKQTCIIYLYVYIKNFKCVEYF